MLSLSACVLVGGAVSGFAATAVDNATTAAVVGHQTDACKGYERSEIVARFERAGHTDEYVICAYCGKVDGKSTLSRVSDVVSNFGGVRVRTGKLDNGEKVMTVACYSGSGAMENVAASIEMPESNVEGYDLYLVNADGTQSQIGVSIRNGIAYFDVDMSNGAALIRMVAQG